MKMNGSFIVAWDFSNGKDKEVLLVGEKKEGRIDIVNAFQGEEALEIYKKLAVVEPAKPEGDS